MFKISEGFKKEINKLQGRKFNAKVIIRNKEYSGNQIYEMNLEESVNPSDNFSIGTVCSNTFEIKLINTGDIFDNAIVKPYVGLYIGEDIEYIPLGVFTVIKTSVKGKFINLECVDNMLGLEKVYFSDLSYPADINDIAKEICKKAGVNLASKLPNYRVNKIEGYSLREAIGFIASLCGSFARFNRIGDLEIRGYEVVKQEMTPHNLFKLDIEANECIIKKVIAKKGEEELSTGTDDGNKIVFNNPIITKEILSDIYTKYNGFKYIPYTAKWKGNPAIMAGDILNLTDLKGNKYNALIMEQKFTYKNGISSEVKAKGKTRQDSSFDSKGSVTQSMERYSIEQANIKKALIDKASINDLTAVDAKIQRLYTEDLTAIRAEIVNLNSKKANILDLNSLKATLQQAIITKADITDLNSAVGKINVLESKTASIENALAGNLTADNFKANSITATSGIIAEGAIGSAQISSLSVNKLEAGDITTSKHKIVSADGTIEIVGNQILINRNNVNRVILGEYRKSDGTTEYGLLVRAKDGQTIMLDGNGVHNAGITDGAIDNNKVADNANISGNKLDINSVIREVNTHGTETIKGTKVQIGDRTLDVELSTQKNTITENSKELSSQKTSITALDNALKLKVDSQAFTQSTQTINNNIDLAKNEVLNILDWKIASEEQKRIQQVQDNLNIAKNYTNAEITTVNTNLNRATSEINVLKEKIESKVSQVDIDKSINKVVIGGRNLVLNREDFKFTSSNYGGTNISKKEIIEIADPSGRFHVGAYVQRYLSEKLNNSKPYCISLDLKANGESKNLYLSFFYRGANSPSYAEGVRVSDINNVWKRFTIKMHPNENSNTDVLELVFNSMERDCGVTRIEYRNLKIEEGTIPTADSEAPEDSKKLIVDSIKVVTDKISTVESNFTQENNNIKASVQNLNSTTQTITTNVSNINRNLTSRINSNLDVAKNFATSKATEALNNAKAFVNAEITTVNTKVHNLESNITILTDRINSKVSQSDIDRSITTVDNKIKIVDSKISDVSSSVTQLRDSVTTDIRAINSKTQSIETTLNGKASKQEVTEVNNKVTTIKADLSSITQRVSSAEVKTNKLNDNIQSLSSRMASAEQKITPTAIINTVSSTIDTRINNIEIGGRNYILNSNFINLTPGTSRIDKWRVWGDISVFGRQGQENYNENGVVYLGALKGGGIWQELSSKLIKKDTEYTLSLLVGQEGNVKKSDCYIEYWNGNSKIKTVQIFTFSGGLSLERRSFKFRTITNNFTEIRLVLNHEGASTTSAYLLQVGLIKLEEGKFNTAWTPAPEDVTQEFSEMKANFSVTINGINSEVSKKVNFNEIISRINQSAEAVKIDANKINLQGYVTMSNLGTPGQTVIDGRNIKTGFIEAIQLIAPHITGKVRAYFEAGSVLSSDGEANFKRFYGMPGGTFNVESEATFGSTVNATRFRCNGNYVPFSRSGYKWVVESLQGIDTPNGDAIEFQMVGGTKFGVNIWYSDARLKTDIEEINPLRNISTSTNKTGLELIKAINHYKFRYKSNPTKKIECGYVAQDLQRHNKQIVNSIKQSDGTEILQVDERTIIPNLSLAIQEQQKIIEKLERRIEELERIAI